MEEENNYKEFYDIDKYPIGHGASGSVYKAKIKNKEEYVAIKIIDKDRIKNNLKQEYLKEDISEEYLKIEQSFIKEVESMKKCSLNNNNSIKLYNVYNNEKEFVIVMELCDSNLMDLLIKRKEGFNLSEIYDILIQLNKAFKIMSDNKIAHRDLKPQNILIKYNNKEKTEYTVKITDYGISKAYEKNENFETTIGTLDFIAPEILKGKKYNYKCDLWSLGIIIYMLHFKKNPFTGCTQNTIISKLELGQKIFKKTGNTVFDDLINGLLTKNPKKRLSWKEYFDHSFFKNRPIESTPKINKNDENEKLLDKNKSEQSEIIDAKQVNFNKYENSYNEESFWGKIKNSGKKIGIKPLYIAFLLYYSLSKASFINKALIIGALGYFITPLDLIPDYIPIIGLSDDIAILMFAYYRIYHEIDDEIRDKAKEKLESIVGNKKEQKIIENL